MRSQKNNQELSRRQFIAQSAVMAGALLLSPNLASAFSKKEQHYKIGVIDLMLLKRQKISAFPLAAEIGADGLEVDMGGLGNRETFDNKLSDPAVRKEFLDKAKELNLE